MYTVRKIIGEIRHRRVLRPHSAPPSTILSQKLAEHPEFLGAATAFAPGDPDRPVAPVAQGAKASTISTRVNTLLAVMRCTFCALRILHAASA